jgi:hypothetical protein
MELSELLVAGRRAEVELLNVPELPGRYFSQLALVECPKRGYLSRPLDQELDFTRKKPETSV